MEYPNNTSLPDSIKKVDLKPHNLKTYTEAVGQLSLYNKTAIVQPTGTGKSYIMMKIMQDFYNCVKIIIGPSSTALDLLRDKPEWVSYNTVVTTYNNLDNVIEQLKMAYPPIDVKLIVLDELHRAGAETWNKSVLELLNMYKESAVIGLTATPIRFLDHKRDMVSELFSGISAGNMTLQKAIDSGILPSFDYVLAMFDIEEDINNQMKKLNKRKATKNEQTEEIEAKVVSGKQILESYKNEWNRDTEIISLMKEYIGEFTDKNYKHLVFVPTIEAANVFEKDIRNWFENIYNEQGIQVNVYTMHSGNMNSQYEFEQFKQEKGAGYIDVLISINMASSSFHIPNTKSVTMLRYTSSPNLFLQLIGRALASGGENPIIFDLVGNVEAANSIRAFLYDLESKVNKGASELDSEYITKAYKGIFRTYKDRTKRFKSVMSNVDRLIANKWYVNMYKLLDLVKSDDGLGSMNSIVDLELRKWALSEQKKFINETLTDDKTEKFNELGKLAYLTPGFETYGIEWLELVDSINNKENTDEAMKIMLTFRLYCGLLPKELEKYIRDVGLDIELNEAWFKDMCYRCSKPTTDKFYALLNTITNSKEIRVLSSNEQFKTEVYLDTIKSIVNLKEQFNNYVNTGENPESSIKSVLVHLLNKYWTIHLSDINSKIETDLGTLRTHISICNCKIGECSDYDKEVLNRILSAPDTFRPISTNTLLKLTGFTA